MSLEDLSANPKSITAYVDREVYRHDPAAHERLLQYIRVSGFPRFLL